VVGGIISTSSLFIHFTVHQNIHTFCTSSVLGDQDEKRHGEPVCGSFFRFVVNDRRAPTTDTKQQL